MHQIGSLTDWIWPYPYPFFIGPDYYRIGLLADRFFLIRIHIHLFNHGSDRVGSDIRSIYRPLLTSTLLRTDRNESNEIWNQKWALDTWNEWLVVIKRAFTTTGPEKNLSVAYQTIALKKPVIALLTLWSGFMLYKKQDLGILRIYIQLFGIKHQIPNLEF